jgi:uncharacterized membrane protein YgcG
MKPLVASILALADTGWYGFLYTMRGPDFLWLYFVWFIVSFGVVLLTRWRGNDSPWVTAFGVLAYEGLGLLRIVVGSMHDLHRWTFLILMMILGGLIFFIRVEFTRSGGDGGTWWGSSCSGGSGGGSGGGGGGGVAAVGVVAEDAADQENWTGLSS